MLLNIILKKSPSSFKPYQAQYSGAIKAITLILPPFESVKNHINPHITNPPPANQSIEYNR